jgi:hypothetical protein
MTKQNLIEKIGAIAFIPHMGNMGVLMDVRDDAVTVISAITGNDIIIPVPEFIRRIKEGNIILK